MKTLTVADIRSWHPCYDPVETGLCTEDWQGTILDILADSGVPVLDRIWCGIQCMDDRQRRLFAVWCARQALALVDNPDPRSVHAVDVAERYANGGASKEELYAARSAAEYAAWYAAWSAAESAAWSAAWSAAREEQLAKLQSILMEDN